MNQSILIVEDQFIEANDLRLMLQKAGYRVTGIARSVPNALELIGQEKPDVVLLDIFLKGPLTGIDLAKQLKEDAIPFIYLSANSTEDVLTAAKATQPDGFLVKPFREKDVLVTLEVAKYRHEHSQEASFRRGAQLLKQLTKLLAEPVDWEQKLLNIGKAIQPFIPFDYMATGFAEANTTAYTDQGYLRIGFDEYQLVGPNELMVMTNLKRHELAVLQAKTPIETEAIWYDEHGFKRACQLPSIRKLIADTFLMRSHLVLPLVVPSGEQFNFSFYSRRPDAYQEEHSTLFSQLKPVLTTAIENRLNANPKTSTVISTPSTESISQASDSLSSPTTFEGIVGSSHLLLTVFDHLSLVAPSDTSVLILGESGTGKERIASTIHNLSPRKRKPLIRVNCATLPVNLIESELFGHEKGSFTGATEKRIGRFEQADGGTIFLDEIGEMPVELQVKLLRVLQEKEIERIGGQSSIKINVRIIAATNRNLEKEVAEGRFRLDLYYRLNVFPVSLPPLRDRKEDIPALVQHFIRQYNQKTGKKITGLSAQALSTLQSYHWPGNIRELEHLIERSVLLTKGTLIEEVGLLNMGQPTVSTTPEEHRIKTIDENERDHIIAVLKKCNGRIWGAGGAAEMLNVPPTTLNSKMKKLGIRKEYMDNH
ncbi:sigma 54-interacting response regulator [Spirosoma foliorum]|uniref:Sigma 54-interacting transcriptional regulator n=1 Tax=Spirosoma foliorum TaxID=2710596 RepID=A0A7G5GZ85_9BACT|nr:sigma 54-interacting response regulator [Spirosoma foliorum]QMW04177.1 sigma 54-interacting transcriptional regulator [Spirosoma foliorum]